MKKLIIYQCLIIGLLTFSTCSIASAEDPRSYANFKISNCGRVGKEISVGGGSSGARSAGFEVICANGTIGTIHIQVGGNMPSVVNIRRDIHDNPEEFGTSPLSQTRSLVRRAIRSICDCK